MPKSEGALELVLSWYGVDPWVNTPIKGKDHLCKPAQLPGRLPPSPSTLPCRPGPTLCLFLGIFGTPEQIGKIGPAKMGEHSTLWELKNVYGSAQSTANFNLQQALLQAICCHSIPLYPLAFNGSLRLAILPRGVADAHMATTAQVCTFAAWNEQAYQQ